jgi:hypothetical protein
MVTQGRKSSFDSELPAMIPFNVLGLQSSVEASLVASWGFAFYPLRHIISESLLFVHYMSTNGM